MGIYAYDPLGRRVRKSGTGVATTRFINSGNNVLAEYDGSGNLLRRFVLGPSIDHPIAMLNYSSGSEVLSFFYTDKRGSTITMGNAEVAIEKAKTVIE